MTNQETVISRELKRLREDACYSQADLAVESGVSRSVISRLERGHLNVRLDKVIRLFWSLGYLLKIDLVEFET